MHISNNRAGIFRDKGCEQRRHFSSASFYNIINDVDRAENIKRAAVCVVNIINALTSLFDRGTS